MEVRHQRESNKIDGSCNIVRVVTTVKIVNIVRMDKLFSKSSKTGQSRRSCPD